jgi:plasmid stabilization system protein ParE
MIIKWSPLSVERLTDVVNHIATENPIAARQTATTIFDAVENLSLFPKSGRIVPELDSSKYREILIGNFRIIYSIVDEAIHILTVRHQKQLLRITDIK